MKQRPNRNRDGRTAGAKELPINASSEVVIEAFEGITDERQAHLGALLSPGHGALLASRRLLCLKQRCVVGLIDLISGEISRIDVASKTRLKWCPNAAKRVELYASEEAVVLDLMRASTTQSVLRVTDQAKSVISGQVQKGIIRPTRAGNIENDRV